MEISIKIIIGKEKKISLIINKLPELVGIFSRLICILKISFPNFLIKNQKDCIQIRTV